MTLVLPITPAIALARIINPALAMLPPELSSDAARVLLLATALQESGLRRRVQMSEVEARGLWRFERARGVSDVLNRTVTRELAADFAERCGVESSAIGVYNSLAADDLLACGFARLLLYGDPAPLPPVDDSLGAWACYLRAFNPGKPRQREWADNYAAAMSAVVRVAAA